MCDCDFAVFYNQLSGTDKTDILHGAYVKVLDRGALYSKLIKTPCATASCSSHRSSKLQYRCVEEGYNLLYGFEPGYTWFQIERFSIGFPGCCCHMFTYMVYVCRGVNVGPTGVSAHTEAHPLVIYNKKRAGGN